MNKLTKEQRLNNSLKEVEIKERQVNLLVREVEIKERSLKIITDEKKLTIDKINTIADAVRAITVCEDSMPGSEQKLKPIFDESERQSLKDKIFKLVHTL